LSTNLGIKKAGIELGLWSAPHEAHPNSIPSTTGWAPQPIQGQ